MKSLKLLWVTEKSKLSDSWSEKEIKTSRNKPTNIKKKKKHIGHGWKHTEKKKTTRKVVNLATSLEEMNQNILQGREKEKTTKQRVRNKLHGEKSWHMFHCSSERKKKQFSWKQYFKR